ncbi:peptidase S45 penicillin amidase [Alcanivorax hongdengensis A-11-3]|uniref:Peptidase S45 penicillin amidase n=1 Tax=Alcanivorax hongdengensis A-11-3 TaxID=1177179 RepID=L0WEE3_9GAMM|nr:penicillin acylase family protein [Alcanivorax hongdengensis]EKF74522.1 peptidase S45 penicillin amidase [Alcanivorax hongdengensis A-11-3]
MKSGHSLNRLAAALFTAGLLTACGGGGGGSSPAASTPTPTPNQPDPVTPTEPAPRPSAVTAPYADYGPVLNILPPGQDDGGGLGNLTQDIPGLGDLINTLLNDLVAETGLVPALTKEPHFDDQLPIYDALSHSQPGLTDDQLTHYFKPAPLLGPDAGNWESETTITSGNYQVDIKRDNFGVPHIFGDSRRDALFGTGYATAADRLFLLDVLRRAGRGQLSRFLGPADFSFDKDIAENAPYREEDLTRQIAETVGRFGDDGAQVYQDATDYVAGLNKYVADAQAGLLQVPIEYVGLGVQLEPFKIEDVVAIATLIQGIFAGGGGDEQKNVLLLQALREQTGSDQAACDLWHDLRHGTDADSTVTTALSFATQSPPSLPDDLCPLSGELSSRFPGAVMFDAGSYQPYEALTTEPCGRPGQASCPETGGNLPALPGTGVVGGLLDNVQDILSGVLSLSFLDDDGQQLRSDWAALRIAMDRLWQPQPEAISPRLPGASSLTPDQRQQVEQRLASLEKGLAGLRHRFPPTMSNALLINAEHTASGQPIAVFGPQTGYFEPQLLLEMSVNGGDIHTRGMTFTGLPYVVIGHGPDFAWSATSGSSDLSDVRVVRLCSLDDDSTGAGGYLYQGGCKAFDVIDQQWAARWNLAVPTDDPSSIGQNYAVHRRAIRTEEYGPVIGYATVNGQPVALTRQRSTYFAELDTALPFMQATRNDPHDVQSFYDTFNSTTGSFNWFYIDDRDIAYFHSGLYPQRSPGVDPELPSWGNGQYDWQGFIGQDAHPHESNPPRGYLASWNNRPARDWWAADANASYGPVHRNDMLEVRLRKLVEQGSVTRANMVEAMGDAAHVDLRGQEVLPSALALLDTAPLTGDQDSAVTLLKNWVLDGAQRRDRDQSGDYDDESAVALMNAWYPLMIDALLPQVTAMEDVDGKNLTLMGRDNKPSAQGSAYQSGDYGYLQRVLDQALGTSQHPYRALRCANSDDAQTCRQALADSLNQAIDQLGGIASMDSWQVDESQDQIQHRAIGLSSVPAIDWQNRPTFQQVVEFTGHR